MSQSSETENNSNFVLGYPHEIWSNNYYTAEARPGIGVCVFRHQQTFMVQFFPWGTPQHPYKGVLSGHQEYAAFIMGKATGSSNISFADWPFETLDSQDILALKCVIEEKAGEIECRLST